MLWVAPFHYASFLFGVPWLGYECYELRLRLCLYYPNRYCIVFLVYVGVVCLDLSFLVCFGPWKHLLARRGYVELVPVVCILNQMVLGQICLAPINHRKNPETDTHP